MMVKIYIYIGPFLLINVREEVQYAVRSTSPFLYKTATICIWGSTPGGRPQVVNSAAIG